MIHKNQNALSSLAFEDAVTRLNSLNIDDLLAISCILSCIDFFDSIDDKDQINVLFPILNFKKISMFDKAILRSKAQHYKEKKLICKDIVYVLNKLTYSETTTELIEETVDVDARVLMMLSRMANDQFRMQKINFITSISRAYALYEYLPEIYKHKIEERHSRNYVNIPKVFEEKYGISIIHYLIIGCALILYYQQLLKRLFILPESKRKELRNRIGDKKLLTKVLCNIIDTSLDIRHEFFFFLSEIKISKNITINDVQCFLDLLSKSKKELESIQREDPFNKGDHTYRVCALERYPIVRQENETEEKYIIPNMRYFDVSISKLLHFLLQDLYPQNQFNETFGSVFEYYVHDLIIDRGRDIDVIPEIRYRKNKNYIDGPDFTIIDENSGCMIVIEVKSKSVRIDSRLMPLSDSFISDLDRVFQAFEKLPDKIEDLYHGFHEYSKWQNRINKISKNNVFCLVVINSGIYLMPELVHLLTKNRKGHILNRFKYKYALIDIEHFEHLMELSYDKNEPIIDILLDYYNSSTTEGFKKHSADLFGGRILEFETEDYYLKKYLNNIMEELRK